MCDRDLILPTSLHIVSSAYGQRYVKSVRFVIARPETCLVRRSNEFMLYYGQTDRGMSVSLATILPGRDKAVLLGPYDTLYHGTSLLNLERETRERLLWRKWFNR